MVLVEKSARAMALRCEMLRQRLLDCLEPDPFGSLSKTLRLVRTVCAAAGKIVIDAADLDIEPFRPEMNLSRPWLLIALQRIQGEIGEYYTDAEHGHLPPLGFPDVLYVLEELPAAKSIEDIFRRLVQLERQSPESGVHGYTVEEFMCRHVLIESLSWLPGVQTGIPSTTKATFVSRDGYPINLLVERESPEPLEEYIEVLVRAVGESLDSMQRLLEEAAHRGDGVQEGQRADGAINPKDLHVHWSQSTEQVRVRLKWESSKRNARSVGKAKAVLIDLVRAANTTIDRQGREIAEAKFAAQSASESDVIGDLIVDPRRNPKIRELLRSDGLPPGLIKLDLAAMEMTRFRDLLKEELGESRVPPASELFPPAKRDELDEYARSQPGVTTSPASARISYRSVAFHFGYEDGT